MSTPFSSSSIAIMMSLAFSAPGGPEQLKPRGVTVENFDPELSDQLNLVGVKVENRRLHSLQMQNSSDDVAEPAKSRQNHRVMLFIDLVSFPFLQPARKTWLNEAFVNREEERRCDHRQGHRRDEQVTDLLVERIALCGERDQYEGKLPALSQSEGESEILAFFQFAELTDDRGEG